MLSKKIASIAGGVALLSLGACGTTAPGYGGYPATSSYPSASYPSAGTNANIASGYGVVQNIDLMPRQSAANGLGIGTIAGAVVGGVLGHQIGQGTGNTAATIAGAAGGALAGRAIENNTQQNNGQVYRITLRMDDGTMQSLVQEAAPSLRVGDRVRIANGVIERL
jgi:outer membrane lipoprotein SlyB